MHEITFLQPYAFDLEIGTAYNKAIEKAEGWICITDQDTLKPPGFAERVHDVIKRHGNKNRLFGCMVNRVGRPQPALVPNMYMNDSITDHLEVSKTLWEVHKTDIEPTKIVPGYCMVFHKDLAKRWKPFTHNTYKFDIEASNQSECMLMKGVYIIHLYRWGLKEPKPHIEHLLKAGILK